MANTGTVKFFTRSKTLISDGAIAEANSGENSVNNILSFDRDNYWQSIDETDGSISNISIQLSKQSPINRLLIVDTNIKQVSITFDRPITFASDIDNNDIAVPIIYQNSNNVMYFEFDTISPITVDLSFSETIIPNQRKYIRQIILAQEIGNFIGFPTVRGFSDSFNEVVTKSSTGVKHVTKQLRIMDKFKLSFRAYPVKEDIDLSNKLFESRESFTLWPSGGGYGSNHFLFPTEGWQLDNIYNVQTTGRKPYLWYKNFYKSGVSTSLNMIEVV